MAAFAQGIPVHLLLQGFETSQTILDRAYLGLSGRSRFTADERQKFFLLTKGVKHSSLDSWMDIVLIGVETTFPLLGALGPAGIWEYSKQAYELLKFAYEAVKKGEQPTYQNNGDGTLSVNNGSQTNIYNAPVYYIAQASQRVYVDMAKSVNSGRIDSFSLTEKQDGTGIRVAHNEAAYRGPLAWALTSRAMPMKACLRKMRKTPRAGQGNTSRRARLSRPSWTASRPRRAKRCATQLAAQAAFCLQRTTMWPTTTPT